MRLAIFVLTVFISTPVAAQGLRFASWPEVIALIPCDRIWQDSAGTPIVVGPIQVEEKLFDSRAVTSRFEAKELSRRCWPVAHATEVSRQGRYPSATNDLSATRPGQHHSYAYRPYYPYRYGHPYYFSPGPFFLPGTLD